LFFVLRASTPASVLWIVHRAYHCSFGISI
jgi:hypothetical protein